MVPRIQTDIFGAPSTTGRKKVFFTEYKNFWYGVDGRKRKERLFVLVQKVGGESVQGDPEKRPV